MTTETDRLIAVIVAAAPPLTDTQRTELAALLAADEPANPQPATTRPQRAAA